MTNPCAAVLCPKDTICDNGNCIPIPSKCSTDEECGLGQKCSIGVCVDKCSGVSCSKSELCVQGKCQPLNCGKNTFCPSGSYCEAGVCRPDILVCPANAKYTVKTCTQPRPNEKTCPQIFYIRAPDPAFCGVKADGTRVNFAEECTTCKDKSIVYYFDKPCHKVPAVCDKS